MMTGHGKTGGMQGGGSMPLTVDKSGVCTGGKQFYGKGGHDASSQVRSGKNRGRSNDRQARQKHGYQTNPGNGRHTGGGGCQDGNENGKHTQHLGGGLDVGNVKEKSAMQAATQPTLSTMSRPTRYLVFTLVAAYTMIP